MYKLSFSYINDLSDFRIHSNCVLTALQQFMCFIPGDGEQSLLCSSPRDQNVPCSNDGRGSILVNQRQISVYSTHGINLNEKSTHHKYNILAAFGGLWSYTLQCGITLSYIDV